MLSCKHTYRRRKGFTLMELMISVVVMVLMMLAFGMIVTEAQKVVSTTENVIRGNMTADTIARVIQNDFAQLTKTGFLCIVTKEGSGNHTPVLLFTTSGLKYSKIDAMSGNCGISIYGHANNDAAESNYPLFLRLGWILNSADTSTSNDVWPIDMSTLQGYTRFQLSRDIIDPLRNLPTELTVPPVEWSQVQNLWEVMATESNRLSILWTDGTKDAFNNINWYGIDSNADGDNWFASKLDYDSVVEGLDEEADVDNLANIEFNSSATGGTGGYEALWTHHDTSNWPKAIKIRFRLRDQEIGKEHTEDGYTDYEVICNIP